MFSIRLAILIILIGLVIISGWVFHLPHLIQFPEGTAYAAFNSGIVFCLVGLAILLFNSPRKSSHNFGLIVSIFIFCFAFTSLIEFIFNTPWSIGQVFMNHGWISQVDPYPGRISFQSSLCFLITSIVLISLHYKMKIKYEFVIEFGCFIIYIISFINMIAYASKFKLFYAWQDHIEMPAITSLGCFLISLAIWKTYIIYSGAHEEKIEKISRKISLASIIILSSITLLSSMFIYGILINKIENAEIQKYEDTAFEVVTGLEIELSDSRINAELVNDFIKQELTEANLTLSSILQTTFSFFKKINILHVSILDENNKIIGSVGERIDTSHASISHTLDESHTLLWVDDMSYLRTITHAVYKNKPIKIVVEQSNSLLAKYFTYDQNMGKSGESIICGTVNSHEMFCFPSRHHPSPSHITPKKLEELAPVMKKALQGNNGSHIQIDSLGKNVLSIYKYLAPYKLGLLVKVDLDELYAPLKTQNQLIILIVLIFSTIGVILLRLQWLPLIRKTISSEQALQKSHSHTLESEARFKTVMDASPLPIIATDLKGIIILFNHSAERLLGYSQADVINKESIMTIYKAHHASKPVKKIMELIAQKTNKSIDTDSFKQLIAPLDKKRVDEQECLFLNQNGKEIPVLVYLTALRGANDEVIGYVSIAQDITERKAIDRMKSEFISTVSHELRTPLTSICGALGLVLAGVGGQLNEKINNLLVIAQKNSERLTIIVNDILDIEKIQLGQLKFNLEWVNLQPIIKQALELNYSYGQKFKVKFVLKDPTYNPRIRVDVNRLIQVFSNLLSNAAKFSPTNSNVDISTELENNLVRINFRDYGPGISEEFQKKIFNKFAQADTSINKQRNGTGLGLNISQTIIEKLGGKIGFTTEVGKGTTFYITLPIMPDPYISTLRDDTKPRLLICEDDIDVSNILRQMLEREGYIVDNAYNAEQAETLIEQFSYAAVTVDLILPDKNGIQLIQDIRKRFAKKELPILIISAKANEDKQHLNASGLGITNWLAKPIDQEIFIETLNKVTQKSTVKAKILYIEESKTPNNTLLIYLEHNTELLYADNLEYALNYLNQDLDLIILDLSTSNGWAVAILERIKESFQIPVVVFSDNELSIDMSKNIHDLLLTTSQTDMPVTDMIKSFVSKTDFTKK